MYLSRVHSAITAIALCAMLASPFRAYASTVRAPENQVSLTPSRMSFDEDFGIGGFAYTNGMAFLGNEDADGAAGSEGIVYMSERVGTSWAVTARLRPPVSDRDIYYGRHIAASSNTLAVSAPGLDSVFIYSYDGTTWTLQTTLGSPLNGDRSSSGKPVALNGDTLVTAENSDTHETVSRLAVYQRNGEDWECMTSLSVELANSFRSYGDVLDVLETTSGCLIACSSPATFSDADNRLVIYRVTGTSWTLEQELHRTCSFPGYEGYTANWHGNDVAISSMGGQTGVMWGFMGDDAWGPLSGSATFLSNDGTSWTLPSQIYPSDPKFGDLFGCGVDILHTDQGTFAAVGAVRSDSAVTRGGALYLFRRDGSSWNQIAKVAQPDGFTYDNFGQVVGLSYEGSHLTAWASAPHLGRAWYAFDVELSDPSPQDPATADAPHERDTIGASVAISGDWAAVGSPLDDEAAHDAGAVYIYHRTGDSWTPAQKLTAPDAAPLDSFGVSLAMTTDTLAVGAWNHNGYGNARDPLPETDSGAVYLWRRHDLVWQIEDTVASDNPTAPDMFGQTVDLLGDYLIVGARAEDVEASQDGVAYIFHRTGSTWAKAAVLKPKAGVSTHGYARDVSLCDSVTGYYAFVSYSDGSNAIDVFRPSGESWALDQTLVTEASSYYAPTIESHICRNGYPMVAVIAYDPEYSAYVYKTDDGQKWHKEAWLVTSNSQADTAEGCMAMATTTEGIVAILGARGYGVSDADRGTGAAYVYRNRDRAWALQEVVHNPVPHRGDLFGHAVAIGVDGSRCVALIGEPGDDSVTVNGGAAHFYDIDLDAFTFPPFLPTEQTYAIESDDSFWCGAWDFTANAWNATADGPGPGSLHFSLRSDRWIGAYLYDYASGGYTEGKHTFLDSTLD